MMFVWPARHVEPDFADERLRDADVDASDTREVHAADAVQFRAQVKVRGMAARLPMPLGTGALWFTRPRG
jgi:hypothetical protein